MSASSHKDDVKAISIAICAKSDENEAYIVKTEFERLYEGTVRPNSATNENAWSSLPDVATYALLVVVFVRDIFVKAAADKVMDELAKKLRAWLDKKLTSPEDTAGLQTELLTLVKKSDGSPRNKERLAEAIRKSF